MSNWLARQSLMIGEENTKLLADKTIMIIGLGGVGGAVVDCLSRTGIKNFVLVDNDVFDETNLNRQILCLKQSVGVSKVSVAKQRILDINPFANVIEKEMFYLPELKDELFSGHVDYIVDAVDTVSAKLDIICTAKNKGIKVISSMGMGNRLDPSKIRIGDISDTKGNGCGLSRVMRKELKKRSIKDVKVVYSVEIPKKTVVENKEAGRYAPGSISFMPPVSGYFMASEVVRDLLNIK